MAAPACSRPYPLSNLDSIGLQIDGHRSKAARPGQPLPMTTTYRVNIGRVGNGRARIDEKPSSDDRRIIMPRAALTHWIRLQHPADVVRILLLLLAIAAAVAIALR